MTDVETVMTKCDFSGCKHAPLYAPKINIPFIGLSLDQHEPISGLLGLQFCERHFGEIKIEDFSNLESLVATMTASLPNTLQPDFKRAWFSKIKLGSEEFNKLNA